MRDGGEVGRGVSRAGLGLGKKKLTANWGGYRGEGENKT